MQGLPRYFQRWMRWYHKRGPATNPLLQTFIQPVIGRHSTTRIVSPCPQRNTTAPLLKRNWPWFVLSNFFPPLGGRHPGFISDRHRLLGKNRWWWLGIPNPRSGGRQIGNRVIYGSWTRGYSGLAFSVGVMVKGWIQGTASSRRSFVLYLGITMSVWTLIRKFEYPTRNRAMEDDPPAATTKMRNRSPLVTVNPTKVSGLNVIHAFSFLSHTL